MSPWGQGSATVDQMLADGRLERVPANPVAAQGLIAIILWGFGSLVGTYLAGAVMQKHLLAEPKGDIAHDWAAIWSTPAWIAVGVLVVFMLFFRNPEKKSEA